MQVHVALYGAARVVSGQSVVDLSFDAPTITLAQMLEKLIASYPRVRPYLLDTSGLLQTSIRVLINKERPDPDATLETSLHDEDQVTLLVAVAGGDLHRFVTTRHTEANCSFQTTINHM
jgi:molybdopterin converting factor small subunit